MSEAESRGRGVRTALLSAVGGAVVRVIGHTWRIERRGEEHLLAARATGRGVIMAIWHGELLPLIWSHRGRGIAPLISTHADGEMISRVVAALGFEPIRGSSSRGGARALLEAVRALRAGTTVAFTTDGPRGPRRVSAAGVGVAAAKANAVVVPLGCVVDRAWRFRSWDRFVVPKPFARIVVRYHPMIEAEGVEVEDGERLVPAIDAALMTVCEPDAT